MVKFDDKELREISIHLRKKMIDNLVDCYYVWKNKRADEYYSKEFIKAVKEGYIFAIYDMACFFDLENYFNDIHNIIEKNEA